jgi:hypothetical protein
MTSGTPLKTIIINSNFSELINYRGVDPKESQRRIYEDSVSSGGQWKPDAYQVIDDLK